MLLCGKLHNPLSSALEVIRYFLWVYLQAVEN